MSLTTPFGEAVYELMRRRYVEEWLVDQWYYTPHPPGAEGVLQKHGESLGALLTWRLLDYPPPSPPVGD